MAKLTITEGDRTLVHEILEDEILIGTKDEATIRIADPEASGEHGQVRRVPGVGFKLIDLESRNGTKVNGAFVNQHVLKNGDVIHIGAVRITFSAEGESPPPALPPPPGPRAATTAVAAPPRSAPPRVAARPAVPREERMPRSRRQARPGSGPLIVLGVIVGLLFFFLIVGMISQSWSHTVNETVWFDVQDLMRAKRYEEALARAQQADPSEDREYYVKVQAQVSWVKDRIASRDSIGTLAKVKREYDEIEIWIQNNRDDVDGAATKWEEYIARRQEEFPFWANQARQRLGDLLGTRDPGGGSEPPAFAVGGGGGAEPTGTAKIDRAWTVALAESRRFEGQDRFQDAIDALWDFFEENQHLAEDLDAWQGKVKSTERSIAGHAKKRFEQLDELAKSHVDKGEYDRALKIYRKIGERFGIPEYMALANKALRRLNRD